MISDINVKFYFKMLIQLFFKIEEKTNNRFVKRQTRPYNGNTI